MFFRESVATVAVHWVEFWVELDLKKKVNRTLIVNCKGRVIFLILSQPPVLVYLSMTFF